MHAAPLNEFSMHIRIVLICFSSPLMKPNGFPGNEIMQSFSDNAKCAERFVPGVCFFFFFFFLSVCTRGTAQRCQDASRYPFVQPRERKKDLSQCSAYLYVSHTACDLFIYLLFNYSLRLSMYAVLWLPGV